MEKSKKNAVVPLDYLRGLIIAQNGRCAITGVPLDPKHVNADHINPLSRKDLSSTETKENIWLVHKKINAMKGTLSYEELIQLAKQILDNHKNALNLLGQIQANKIKSVSKDEFDKWVKNNCTEDGKIKSEENDITKAMDRTADFNSQ